MTALSDYDYELPEDRIAMEPLADRAASKLLALDKLTGEVRHLHFRDCISLLRPDDVLVLNRTRVTAVRLLGHRMIEGSLGGAVELLLLRRLGTGQYECLAKPAKRLPVGSKIQFGDRLTATILASGEGGLKTVLLEPEEEIERVGIAPLPPYIKKPLKERERYQTVYARQTAENGSAAAPTAGLHFTKELLDQIRATGVEIAEVELSIGLDTFRPIQSDNLEAHQMQGETCHMPEDAAQILREAEGRIIAVGTTSARTIESFGRLAGSREQIQAGSLESKLFLHPGNPPQFFDALFTNFHMPRTSMLVMLSALAGREAVLNAYRQALQENYRFLSFGDSMFVGNLPEKS